MRSYPAGAHAPSCRFRLYLEHMALVDALRRNVADPAHAIGVAVERVVRPIELHLAPAEVVADKLADGRLALGIRAPGRRNWTRFNKRVRGRALLGLSFMKLWKHKPAELIKLRRCMLFVALNLVQIPCTVVDL